MEFIKKTLLFVFFLIITCPSFALNPESVDSAILQVIQNGSLEIDGYIESVNISLYIPQEEAETKVKYIQVDTSGEYYYIADDFGNKILLLKWNKPKGKVKYKITMIIENNARHLLRSNKIAKNNTYLRETDTIILSPSIREFVYPYSRTLERAAELTSIVHDLIRYDESLVSERRSSEWVFNNKRGVCVEFSNLLTALLRASGIPTRYITGYAYSERNNKFMGHSWVEVLTIAENNSYEWVSFDPTWEQGGYLDATHIKIASLLDSNQTDVLSYRGRGSIKWNKGDVRIELINHTTNNITKIRLDGENKIPKNGYGYLEAKIMSDECSLMHLKVSSCVDENGNEMLEVYDNERKLWFCDDKNKSLYWIYKDKGYDNYICPIIIYDQIGSQAKKALEVSGVAKPRDLFISGPNTVKIHEKFVLSASNDGLFFSPTLNKRHNDKKWQLSINRPGSYKFYFYNDNSLAMKNVDVVKEKGFSIMVKAPKNTTLNSSFFVNVTLNNLLNRMNDAIIRVEMNDQKKEKFVRLKPLEKKSLLFNLTAARTGNNKITVSALSDSLSSYSTSIFVYEEKTAIQGLLENILNFFSGLLDAISNFYRGLFQSY